ncbi:uncharacterized protein LOC113553484 [Rhopalosiphum maidis]|uniref:uncharacterized protein LOC113553484 n=1 Tax=Rhopalosiphum maidis TaxID=43146 RepID=UPI000EFF93F9|nr:uncharacterized protein LOC113553484 [Rhopalosiphum maidis]
MISYKVLTTLTAFLIISYGCTASKEEDYTKCCAELKSVEFSDSNGFLNACIIRSFEQESDFIRHLEKKFPKVNLSENIIEFVQENFLLILCDDLSSPLTFCQLRQSKGDVGKEIIKKWPEPVQDYHNSLIERFNKINKIFDEEFLTSKIWCMKKCNITEKDLSSMKILE